MNPSHRSTFVIWFAAKWALFRGSTITNLPTKRRPRRQTKVPAINGAQLPLTRMQLPMKGKGRSEFRNEARHGDGCGDRFMISRPAGHISQSVAFRIHMLNIIPTTNKSDSICQWSVADFARTATTSFLCIRPMRARNSHSRPLLLRSIHLQVKSMRYNDTGIQNSKFLFLIYWRFVRTLYRLSS